MSMPASPRKPAAPEHRPRWRLGRRAGSEVAPQAARAGGTRAAHLDVDGGAAGHQPARLISVLEGAEPAGDFAYAFRTAGERRQCRGHHLNREHDSGRFQEGDGAPAGTKGTAAIKFKNQLPTFVNNRKLDALLAGKGVVINANNPDATTPLWQQLLLGCGPTHRTSTDRMTAEPSRETPSG
jgi:hypothetical protein